MHCVTRPQLVPNAHYNMSIVEGKNVEVICLNMYSPNLNIYYGGYICLPLSNSFLVTLKSSLSFTINCYIEWVQALSILLGCHQNFCVTMLAISLSLIFVQYYIYDLYLYRSIINLSCDLWQCKCTQGLFYYLND